ncbi:alginate export family protein [Sphingobium bisphenolivorans]|uniref:alginate export family protein n=1 Tax=Sphingobium bisphenolivorans TaxID=1335760 RepID=UPI0003A2BBC1|nr:alginate export family protein [Sphingobium bisphenolivorans]
MRKPLLLQLLQLLLLATPAAAQPREAWQPPTLTNTRYDEDWSKQSGGRWTEELKHVPLNEDGSAWVGTGLELRARLESFGNNLWGGAAAPDDAYLWTRAMPYVDLHLGKLRAFVQPIAAHAVGVAPAASPIDQTRADLLQGFVEVEAGAVTLRGGRQMLSLGTERLIGTRYGPNVPLAFDGVRADLREGGARLSVFAVRPVQARPGSFDDRTSPTRALWGIYAAWPGLDAYYLGYRNRAASFGGIEGRELRHSMGLRVHGASAEWRWNVEGVVQFGRFEGQEIRAWTLGTEIAREFPALPLQPRATMRFNIISGDKRADDGRLGTFNALFPKGKYFGELSPIGPYNIINLHPGASFALRHDLSLDLAAMAYWRASKGDGIYDIPGNLIRAPGGATARFIGKQAEASLSWQATPELELSTSLSAFAPGAYIRETGPARTITMLGLEANFRY